MKRSPTTRKVDSLVNKAAFHLARIESNRLRVELQAQARAKLAAGEELSAIAAWLDRVSFGEVAVASVPPHAPSVTSAK